MGRAAAQRVDCIAARPHVLRAGVSAFRHLDAAPGLHVRPRSVSYRDVDRFSCFADDMPGRKSPAVLTELYLPA